MCHVLIDNYHDSALINNMIIIFYKYVFQTSLKRISSFTRGRRTLTCNKVFGLLVILLCH